MGFGCGCSQALRAARLQFASYPMDWTGSPGVKASAEMIANDFAGWLDRDDLELVDVRRGTGTINRVYANRKTGFIFAHDFHHDSDFDETFETVAGKYDRRIKRLMASLGAAKRALAVFVEHPVRERVMDEEVAEARKTLSKKFPGADFDLIYLHHAAAASAREPSPGVVILAAPIMQLEYGLVSHTFDREPLIRYLVANAHVADTRGDEEKLRFEETFRDRRERRFGSGGALARWWTKQQYRLHRKLETDLRGKGLLPIDRPFWF